MLSIDALLIIICGHLRHELQCILHKPTGPGWLAVLNLLSFVCRWQHLCVRRHGRCKIVGCSFCPCGAVEDPLGGRSGEPWPGIGPFQGRGDAAYRPDGRYGLSFQSNGWGRRDRRFWELQRGGHGSRWIEVAEQVPSKFVFFGQQGLLNGPIRFLLWLDQTISASLVSAYFIQAPGMLYTK